MKNFLKDGKTLVSIAAADVVSGALVIVGVQPGVAAQDALTGAELVLHTEGVFDLPKATGAVNPGVKVYWDATNSNVTTTASGNTLIGLCWSPAQVASATTTIPVKLMPAV